MAKQHQGNDLFLNVCTRMGTPFSIAGDLSAAAHLIRGPSEQRFTIRWCPGPLSKEEVKGVRVEYGDLETMLARYDLRKLRPGHNRIDGEEIFFIAHPGLGLWACRDKLCVELERGP
jgi:hypothetical protein